MISYTGIKVDDPLQQNLLHLYSESYKEIFDYLYEKQFINDNELIEAIFNLNDELLKMRNLNLERQIVSFLFNKSSDIELKSLTDNGFTTVRQQLLDTIPDLANGSAMLDHNLVRNYLDTYLSNPVSLYSYKSIDELMAQVNKDKKQFVKKQTKKEPDYENNHDNKTINFAFQASLNEQYQKKINQAWKIIKQDEQWRNIINQCDSHIWLHSFTEF